MANTFFPSLNEANKIERRVLPTGINGTQTQTSEEYEPEFRDRIIFTLQEFGDLHTHASYANSKIKCTVVVHQAREVQTKLKSHSYSNI